MDLHKSIDHVIKRIEEDLTAGRTASWRKGWSLNTMPRSYAGREYHGINILFLSGGATNCWLTPNLIKTEGGTLKEGAVKQYAVLWKIFRKKIEEDGGVEYRRVPFARMFELYNLGDVEGVAAPPWYVKQEKEREKKSIDPAESVEAVKDDYLKRAKGLYIFHDGGNRAYYVPSTHDIHLPPLDSFHTVTDYYDTLFHELGHSTGHKDLLDRLKGEQWGVFGDMSYSREELVAELCSAMVCCTLNINTDDSVSNSSAYVRGWMKRIRKEPRLLVTAASRAERAARLILNMAPEFTALVKAENYVTRAGKTMPVVAVHFNGGIPDDELRNRMKGVFRAFYCRNDKAWRMKTTSSATVETVNAMLEEAGVTIEKGE